jgi:hypothetical protein
MTKNLDWINLNRQALKEPHAEKRAAQVEEAKAAMKQVLRMAVKEGDSDQRHAVSEALYHLSILRNGRE